MHVTKVIILGVVVIMTLSIAAVGARYFGLWGDTYVERKVFEGSYQRSESIKSRIATDEAVLVEIEAQLQNQSLDANTRTNLEAQARAARVRIRTAKTQQ